VNRLTETEALDLYTRADLHELGGLAWAETRRRHPGPIRTYVVDRNINYTNVCSAGCRFCNFRRTPADGDAYVLTEAQLVAKVEELFRLGGRQILLQGGLHPDLPWTWYLNLLRRLKARFPDLHVHGFSPPEICHFARRFGKSLDAVLAELIDAGLDSIPGGGAEILVDAVRREISPGKGTSAEWLAVMAAAHRRGLRTTATMMFGHVETDAQRIEHLVALRRLQDETGGFTAFICWPFQPAGTALAAGAGGRLRLASAQDYLRTVAMARLVLDNVENLQASWVTQGPSLAQVALYFGANDFGSLMIEENVVAAAGTRFRLSEDELRRAIAAAGFVPARRDCHYRILESPACGTGPGSICPKVGEIGQPI